MNYKCNVAGIQHFVSAKVYDLWAFMSEFKEESAKVVIEQILDVPEYPMTQFELHSR
ncbi:hypothetical protein D3C87_2075520 [compost metagenome]